MKKLILVLLICAFQLSTLGASTLPPVTYTSQHSLPYNDEHINFLGRTVRDDANQTTFFNWTCSGLELSFTGSKVEADFTVLLSEESGEPLNPWITIFLDDHKEPYQIIELNKSQTTYTLFESPSDETHTLRVIRRNEAAFSQTGLVQLNVYGPNSQINEHPTSKDYRIEFIGDSITCGYGNEGMVEDGFKMSQENGLKSYAALAAKELDAHFNYISISGIGLYSNWTPSDSRNDLLLMSEVYPYSDLYLNQKQGQPYDKWDFSTYNPNLIVINLGTNDYSYLQYDRETRFPLFKEAYIDFLKQVRDLNGPDAKILCCISPSQPIVAEDLKHIVESYKQETLDLNIDYLILSVPAPEDGMGGNWHPTVKTHEKMAADLVQKIKEWR